MKIKELIKELEKHNQEAEIDIIAQNQSWILVGLMIEEEL